MIEIIIILSAYIVYPLVSVKAWKGIMTLKIIESCG